MGSLNSMEIECSVYEKICKGDFENIQENDSIEPYLPLLTRVFTQSISPSTILVTRPQVNQLQEYISVLERMTDVPTAPMDTSVHFEESSTEDRIRMVVSELTDASFNGKIIGTQVYAKEIQAIVCLVLSIQPTWLDLTQTVRTLLHLPYGHEIITGIVLNDPFLFNVVLKVIVATMIDSNTECVLAQGEKVLFSLCAVSRTHAISIRQHLIRHRTLPGLVLHISLHFTLDLIVFLCSMIRDENQWLWSFIETSMSSAVVAGVRTFLLERLNTSRQIAAFSSILRCYCALMGLARLPLQNNEFTALIQGITQIAKLSNSTATRLGLCTVLIACTLRSEVLSKSKEGMMGLVENCVRGLYANGSAQSLFFYISLLFYTSQVNEIVNCLKFQLNGPFAIATDALTKFGDCLMKPMFTESIMTRELILQSPVLDLNASSIDNTDALTIRCLYVLLCEKSFMRCRVDPRDWIENQLQHCTLPLHPLLPGIMMEFAECCCASYDVKTDKSGGENSISPFSLTTIKRLLNQNSFAQTALITFYALHYNQRTRAYPNTATATTYPVDAFPIQYIMNRGSDCHILYPALLRLVMEECPELTCLSDFTPPCKTNHRSYQSTSISLTLEKDHEEEFLYRLRYVPAEKLAPLFIPIAQKVLAIGIESTKISRELEVLWNRIRNIHDRPHVLCMNMLACLNQPQKVGQRHRETFSQLVQEPYSVLRCDERVFTNAPLFRIALDILYFFMVASGAATNRRHRKSTEPEASPTNDVLAQECVIVHCLIEIAEKATGNVEIQHDICCFLDRQFRANETILRTVHEQGYSIEMTELLIDQVQMMEKCLSFLPELVRDRDVSLSFLTKFITRLLVRYPKTAGGEETTKALLSRCSAELFNGKTYRDEMLVTFMDLHPIVQIFPSFSPQVLELYFKAQALVPEEKKENLSTSFQNFIQSITT